MPKSRSRLPFLLATLALVGCAGAAPTGNETRDLSLPLTTIPSDGGAKDLARFDANTDAHVPVDGAAHDAARPLDLSPDLVSSGSS